MSPLPIRILLVEDDEDDVVLTRQLLADIDPAGYELDWEPEYEAGLARLSAGGHDVCLVDYQMGRHDGVEFVREAVARGIGCPMILLTGQADRSIDVAAMNAGAADFLNKEQLSPALLERAIRYSIQQKRAEQQRIRLLMEQAARAEAEAENRAKDEFLAVLSHELRTPLSAVLMNVSALEHQADLSGDSRELLRVIKRNVDLEARLIDDLLDLTRVARGKLEIRREVIDVHEQIRYAVRCCCAAEIEDKNLSIVVRPAAAHAHVWGDPARLQQVLWNLIKNAVKFTPPGGRIELSTACTADRIRIDVRDTGIGIKAEALPKIFNAFEQADRSITRRFGGLGLGLAICRALVELHGGTIRAQSDGAGRGATFSIDLPLTTQTQQAEVPPRGGAQPAAGRGGLSILLVEDHADTARAMQRLLKVRGHRVEVASTIADALRALEHGTFDILVSDIGLPDGSGLDLMRQLQLRGGPAPAGIALSGFGMDDDVARSRAAGFIDHLIKPIDLAQLEAAITRAAARQAVEVR